MRKSDLDYVSVTGSALKYHFFPQAGPITAPGFTKISLGLFQQSYPTDNTYTGIHIRYCLLGAPDLWILPSSGTDCPIKYRKNRWTAV